ncbi:helix-turn-helix domain-containing protein [Photobacterium leiognathi]|uniref:helix-turn-helix domain-containing protein n=1 Tax=Photobacterium leiognathi TaxID=553611 RepID=UPI0029812558|nr:helix-turn-helix domain-containing protein [Photobacterium leiognathi]
MNSIPYLKQNIKQSLKNFFGSMNGKEEQIDGLYHMLIAEFEIGILEAVLIHNRNNITKSSEMLGISRGLLSKKIKEYKIDVLRSTFEPSVLDTINFNTNRINPSDVETVLLFNKNNISKTADTFGVERATIYRKIDKKGIDLFKGL